MLVLRQYVSRPPRVVACCSSPIVRARLHNRCSPTSKSEPVEDISEQKQIRSGKVKTKKSFDSLPKRLQLSNGEYAERLPAWDGGLAIKTQHSDGKPQIASRRAASEKVTNVKAQPRSNSTTAAFPGIQDLCQSERASAAASDGMPRVSAGDSAPRNQLAREIQKNLGRFPHCLLLTRVGQFYESYFDQASEVSQLLSIKLARRTWDGQRVLMCGFPVAHLERYLKILVQQHKRSVALCEEFQKFTDNEAKPSFERRVTRIVTPGTLIDESFVNHHENNFLLAIHADGNSQKRSACQSDTFFLIGLAWIDVSTGDVFTRTSTLSDLKDHLLRISPKEIVIDKSLKELNYLLRTALPETDYLISSIHANNQHASPQLEGTVLGSGRNESVSSEGSIDNKHEPDSLSSVENEALAILHKFLQENLFEHAPQSLCPSREDKASYMQIDAQTLGALEIRKNTREGGTSGSLISTIKRTVTAGGARLLIRWICLPSTSLEKIRARQDIVSLFSTRQELREEFLRLLKSVDDATKISQKFFLGKGDFSDLKSVQNTINVWNTIKKRFAFEQAIERKENKPYFRESDWKELDWLMSQVIDLSELARRIEVAIQNEEAQRDAEEVNDENEDISDMMPSYVPARMYSLPGKDAKWTVRPQFSTELADLHRRLEELYLQKSELESKFQRQCDAPSLSLRHNPGHGMHIHMAKSRRHSERLLASKIFEQVSETKSSRIFFNKDWTVLGNAILETALAIWNAERMAFLSLRNEVNEQSHWIRYNAKIFDELDVLCSFARLACEMKFVRPVVDDQSGLSITNGRHPTVERGLLENLRTFKSNSVTIEDASRFHVITGPNMGGKSTFLRQTALIAILAQTGSFVPADSAKIGIIDKIFSRIGAQDDLYRDKSTFMVEMLETADILKNATSRSLIIMDEVGRGTTIRDGLAIAFAVVHHLYHVTRCKVLFATHFHELVDILGFSERSQRSELYPAVQFSSTDAVEMEDGSFAYSHEMRPGVNRNSHGIIVARLAGMPPSVTTLAENVLMELKQYNESWVNSAALHRLGQKYPKQ